MKSKILSLAAILLLGLAVTAFAANPINTVVGSAHDLSADGTGNFAKLSSDSYGNDPNGGINQICVFCHTPHNANTTAAGGNLEGAPLWSKATPNGPYKMYQLLNPNQVAAANPGPVSLACLGCHDGTIAVSTVAFGQKKDKGVGGAGKFNTSSHGRSEDQDYLAGQVMRTGDPNLGTDLRNDHPVGITYTDDPAGAAGLWLNSQAVFQANGKARLFNGKVECASCHEPHNQGKGMWDTRADNNQSEQGYLFLRSSMKASALCLTCHVK